MTSKFYVQKRGPSGGSNIDLTDFTGRKGTPFFDGPTSIIQIGHRYFDGQASQGTFKLMDPDAELPRSDFNYNLPAHALVTWTEDAPGAEVWLSRGRIASSDGGRGVVLVDDEVDFDCTVDDCNVELRGQAFTEPWVRPEESDVARLIALQAYTLNGASSTATHHRDTCAVTVSASHLAPNTNTVTMPAKKYLPGTQPADVVADCGDTAGKMYGVVIHHTGGSHLCLLYIVNDDHSTYASPIKISDHLADWDPDDPSAPVYEPHWEAGKASLYDGQTLLSGMVGIWQAEVGTFVEYAGNDESYDYWVEPYHDAVSTNSTQAAARTAGILEGRRLTHVTHRVSIIMNADQVDMVAAGMSLQIKAAAALGGQYLDSYQTRRIAECQFEPRLDGQYWAHLQLDRPTLRVAPGRGKASTGLPPQPPVSTVPPTATEDYVWDTFDAGGSPPGEDDTGHNISAGPKYGGGYVYAGALDASCQSAVFSLTAGTYHFTATIRSSSSTGSVKQIRMLHDGSTLEISGDVGNAAQTVEFDFTAPATDSLYRWNTTGPETGRKSEVYYVAITHGSSSGGITGTPAPPASTDQLGTTGSSNIYSPIDHQHAAQAASVTLADDPGEYFEGVDVETQLQELGEAKVPAGGTDGQVLTKQSSSDWDVDWEDATGGGGGGGGAVYLGNEPLPTLLQSVKTSADTPDDEFDAGTLDAKWTVVDGSSGSVALLDGSGAGVYDAATRDGWLLMKAGTASGDGVELRQDYTLPDGKCVVAYVTFATDQGAATPANNELWVGIGVNDNDSGAFAGASGQTAHAVIDTDADAFRVIGLAATAPTLIGANTAGSGLPAFNGMFLRVDRSGLNYDLFYSTDGFAWSYIGRQTMGTAANNLWLWARCQATMGNRLVVGVPWFRQGTALAADPWALTAESSGKAWLVDNYDPRDYPASPNALDDEFEGGGSIDAKWTKVNDPSDPDELNQQDFPGYLTVGLTELGTDNFANAIQLYQTAPTGTATMTFIAKVAIAIDADANTGSTDAGEFAGIGIALINSTNSEAVGVGVQFNDSVSDNTPVQTLGFSELFAGFGNTSALLGWMPGEFIYLRLRKTTASAYTSSNTYEMDVSANGITWQEIASGSKTFTTACDRVGFIYRRPKSQAGTPHAHAIADFFRKTA